MLAGELKPRQGRILLANRALASWSVRDAARMRAVLPQQANLAFAFTALEVVELGRFAHHLGHLTKRDREISMQALDVTDAAHLADQIYVTLSGGERARIHAARVLAQVWEPWQNQPRTLLLDEPTAALDLKHQDALLTMVRRFARERSVAVIAVLHDINLAARHADRIAWLQDGRILAQGPPEHMVRSEWIRRIYGIETHIFTHPTSAAPIAVIA
jgi:iron complex transport system ATP-binding protein